MEHIGKSLQTWQASGVSGKPVLTEKAVNEQPKLTEEEIAQRSAKYLATMFNRPYCPACQGEGTIMEHRAVDEPYGSPWTPAAQVFNLGPCPDCGGNRYTPAEIMQRRFQTSGLHPSWVSMFSFDQWNESRNPAMAANHRHVRAWADKPAGTLVLSGGLGVGKTHLGIAAAIRTVQAGLLVRFTDVPRLLDRLRAAYAEDSYAETYAAWAEEPNVLVLDDFGAERATEYGLSTIENLIAWRLMQEKPMLITTNLTPGALPERLKSRFSDGSRVTMLLCEGGDMRPSNKFS